MSDTQTTKTSSRNSAQTISPRPIDLALAGLAKLSQAGHPAERMAQETRVAMASLAQAANDEDEVRTVINELLENLEAGLEAAEEAAADVDRSDKRDVELADRVLVGMKAAVGEVRKRVS